MQPQGYEDHEGYKTTASAGVQRSEAEEPSGQLSQEVSVARSLESLASAVESRITELDGVLFGHKTDGVEKNPVEGVEPSTRPYVPELQRTHQRVGSSLERTNKKLKSILERL